MGIHQGLGESKKSFGPSIRKKYIYGVCITFQKAPEALLWFSGEQMPLEHDHQAENLQQPMNLQCTFQDHSVLWWRPGGTSIPGLNRPAKQQA